MKICGPKCALCGILTSIWGIIQLVLMGIFFYIESVALVEDINMSEAVDTVDDFYSEVTRKYGQNAFNCWIAACLYIVTLVFSGHQFYLNSRSTLTM